jgi:hypothetical protein
VHLGFCFFVFSLRFSFLFVSSLFLVASVPFFYVCSDAREVFFCTSICHVPHPASLEFFWHREQYKFVLRIFHSSLSLSLSPCRCRHSRGGFFVFFSWESLFLSSQSSPISCLVSFARVAALSSLSLKKSSGVVYYFIHIFLGMLTVACCVTTLFRQTDLRHT